MNRAGFSLVEMIVYMALLSFLVMLSFSWVNRYVRSTHEAQKRNSQLVALHTILHRLSDDIQLARAQESKWSADANSLEFYIDQNAISWHREKDKIYRTQNRSKALIASGIKTFECCLHAHNNLIKKIDCQVMVGDYFLSKRMRVCNG